MRIEGTSRTCDRLSLKVRRGRDSDSIPGGEKNVTHLPRQELHDQAKSTFA
ncbi:hypothetical protein [Synechococcus sp. M16CYN]|uniref:hypothetical protein n=1 Tax=Synechococcus sp. M16CYN TaxID=3103139 RepID=UPI00333E500A